MLRFTFVQANAIAIEPYELFAASEVWCGDFAVLPPKNAY